MRFCLALNGSLCIEGDSVVFCCVAKQSRPGLPWNPETELPVERIRQIREALIKGLNGDLDQPIQEYLNYGLPNINKGHPCKGCRYITLSTEEFSSPATDKINNFLNLLGFTCCNAKCTYCTLSSKQNWQKIDTGINKGLNFLLDTGAVSKTCQIWFSNGEPTISNETMKTLSRVISDGYSVLVNTNAICFSPEIEKALACGGAQVQVSLDSYDRESYLAIKGVDKFQDVVENIDKYIAATKKGSIFYLKYIVHSKNNSRNDVNSFVDFCVKHEIRNVSVSGNALEGDAAPGWDNVDSDRQTLKSYGYLIAKLELQGIAVNSVFEHLTETEQLHAKREYAHAIIDLLELDRHDPNKLVDAVIYGFELARLTIDDATLVRHFRKLLLKTKIKFKNIAIFGMGAHARWITKEMEKLDIQPIVGIDNNPAKNKTYKFPVISPVDIASYPIDVIVISSNAYHINIYSYLKRSLNCENIEIVNPYLSSD